MSLKNLLLALPLLASSVSAGTGSFDINNLPEHSENGQQGYNNCGTTDSQSSMCQTAHVNSLNDFCLWAPPSPGVTIGNSEQYEVAWCTQAGHGARLIPEGTIHGAHYLETPHYIQITGTGDLTSLNIAAGDEGGELDPHGADGNGNPIGGLMFHNGVQVKEWTSFMSDSEWCIRICMDAPDAWLWCQHIYDIQGCHWNEPGNYDDGFDSCEGDSTEQPPGIYIVDGQSSTYQQSQGPAPTAHAAGASSNCVAVSALNVAVPNKIASTTSSAISSSATSSSSVESSSSIVSSANASSSIESSSAISSSIISSSSFVTSTTSIVSSSSILSNTSTLPSSTSTLSSASLAVATVTSTRSPSSSSENTNTATAANNAASASKTPSSGAQKLVYPVGASLAAVGLGLVLFA